MQTQRRTNTVQLLPRHSSERWMAHGRHRMAKESIWRKLNPYRRHADYASLDTSGNFSSHNNSYSYILIRRGTVKDACRCVAKNASCSIYPDCRFWDRSMSSRLRPLFSGSVSPTTSTLPALSCWRCCQLGLPSMLLGR
jgi:hypothetical protein